MINYKWIGAIAEKNHQLIWGIIEIEKNGFDNVADDIVATYLMFSGRSDKQLTYKTFIDGERSMIDLIKRKQLKGYTMLSLDQFDELFPLFEKTLKNNY
jgi:hypothetical protein